MDSGQGRVSHTAEPASEARAITPTDATDLTRVGNKFPRAFYIGTGGNVQLLLWDDSAPVTFTNMAAGYHPLRVRQVYATGTTASGLIGLY